MQVQVIGEIVSGASASFTLELNPVPNTLALYGSGIRLQEGIGNDYTIVGQVITILNGRHTPQEQSRLTTRRSSTTTSTAQVGVDVLSPFALTTLQRVKDLLFDPNQTILVTGCTITHEWVGDSITGATIPDRQDTSRRRPADIRLGHSRRNHHPRFYKRNDDHHFQQCDHIQQRPDRHRHQSDAELRRRSHPHD